MLEQWTKLKFLIEAELDKTKFSVNELMHIKKGTLCQIKQWMEDLERKM
jgi:hypothetical protein